MAHIGDSDAASNSGHMTRSPIASVLSAKRPKIAQACEDCRARKVRCDGVKPICGACRRRRRRPHNACVYLSDQTVAVSVDYMSQLEQRVKQLEGNDHASLPTPITDHRSSSVHDLEQGLPLAVDITNNTSHHGDAGMIDASLRDGADAMGNFVATDATFPETSSSAAGFMTQIKSSIAAKMSESQHPSTSAPNQDLPDPWTDPRATLLGRSTADLFVLPSRRAADEMMTTYWNQVHILYPFLLPDRFGPSVQGLFSGERIVSAEVPTYCIMNILFAIVCQITKREAPQEKAAAADVYYRRAALLLQTSVIGRCSLELLQALLLMGQYLQSTEWPRRCWVVVGHAIRTAQALGLHVPITTERLPQQDRELMRRLWHGCVFFDRMVSMTLGRPVVISQADARLVPLPADIDDADLATKPDLLSRQHEGTASRTSFFIRSVKLVDIVEQILSGMYSPSASINEHHKAPIERLAGLDFNRILHIDSSFAEWHDSLPTALIAAKNIADTADPILFRQARILRLRYLQHRILLFRPILSLLMAPEIRSHALAKQGASAERWLPLAMALPCAQECVKCALETIFIIHQQQNWSYEKTVEPLPSWWFEVFFIYTATTALIPARAYSYIRGDITQSELSLAWQRSLDVLQHLAPLSPSAVSCVAALQVLDQELVFEDSAIQKAPAITGAVRTTEATGDRGSDPVEQRLSDDPDRSGAGNVYPSLPSQFDNDLDSMLQMQDFTWLDTLPVDVLTGDYSDLPDNWYETW